MEGTCYTLCGNHKKGRSKKSIGTRFEITDGRYYCSFNISQNIEILEEAGGYDQSLNLTRDKKVALCTI